jgi:hypothetical protein
MGEIIEWGGDCGGTKERGDWNGLHVFEPSRLVYIILDLRVFEFSSFAENQESKKIMSE